MEVITRKEAIKKGLSKYYTGKPCKHGHIAERYIINNGRCVDCSSSRTRAYREANTDKIKDLNKNYYEANREKLKARYRLQGKAATARIADRIAKKYIKNTFNLTGDQITPELIELKRKQIITTRIKREIKNGIDRTRA